MSELTSQVNPSTSQQEFSGQIVSLIVHCFVFYHFPTCPHVLMSEAIAVLCHRVGTGTGLCMIFCCQCQAPALVPRPQRNKEIHKEWVILKNDDYSASADSITSCLSMLLDMHQTACTYHCHHLLIVDSTTVSPECFKFVKRIHGTFDFLTQ